MHFSTAIGNQMKTMDDVRKKMCDGKVKYATKAAANRAAKISGYRVYECSFCDGFHLTKKFVKELSGIRI